MSLLKCELPDAPLITLICKSFQLHLLAIQKFCGQHLLASQCAYLDAA